MPATDDALQDALTLTDRWVGEGAVHGVATAIWHRGGIVATHQVGEAAAGRPVQPDTLFALASVSKPFTATAVLRLVQRGDLHLDLPVALQLPEFGEADDPFADDVIPQLEAIRDRITLRQLLSHTAGLPENAGVKRLRMSDQPSLERMLDIMCGVPLQDAPGEVLRYSNVGPAVAARMAERVTGMPFHTILRDEVLTPWGVPDIHPTVDATLADRIAIVQDPSAEGTPSEGYNSPWWRGLGIPWGGYYAPATDIARFAASFLPGATIPLDRELATEMVTDQAHGVPGGVFSAGIRWETAFWGLGWEVKGTKPRHWTGTRSSPATYCHWGQSGTLMWADPTRDLAVAILGNRTVLRKAWPLSPPRWSDLADAIVAVVDGK
ncbi:MAG: serine hydrolase domain-containing protein [Thermomicrobiales bacterium]